MDYVSSKMIVQRLGSKLMSALMGNILSQG